MEAELDRVVAGCDRLVVVHAGGTPAMTYGTVFAAMTSGVPLRHVQVPDRQAVVEVDVSDLVRRAAAPRARPFEPRT